MHNPTYPYFMAHPFWHTLRICPESNTTERVAKMDSAGRRFFVTEAVKGFYPISYASLLAFKRFSDLTESPEAKAIAHEIYLVEKGEKPLIHGSEMTGVRHCDQLKMMFESLLDEQMDISEPDVFEILNKADIENADLTKSLAICDLIENTAPFVIHFYQDFLVQCQSAMRIPSEKLKRSYLDEHNLTEGDACEEQHIEMLGKMKSSYQHLLESDAYKQEQNNFIRLVEQHFEAHQHSMAAL